jgi:hypothetical protein
MAMVESARWNLSGFLEQLDAWTERESPPEDQVLLVTAWIMSRFDDPYRGVRREPGFPNLWFGTIPDTDNGSGQVVTCAYWIVESTRTVRCDNFGTLSLPI